MLPEDINPEIAQYLESRGYHQAPGTVGFSDQYGNVINLNDRYHALTPERELLEIDPNDINALSNYFNPEYTQINEYLAEAYKRNPYLAKYNHGDVPFTAENIPGADRTELIDGFDRSHMNHTFI